MLCHKCGQKGSFCCLSEAKLQITFKSMFGICFGERKNHKNVSTKMVKLKFCVCNIQSWLWNLQNIYYHFYQQGPNLFSIWHSFRYYFDLIVHVGTTWQAWVVEDISHHIFLVHVILQILTWIGLEYTHTTKFSDVFQENLGCLRSKPS